MVAARNHLVTDRQRLRAKVGSLRKNQVKPKTLLRYLKAVRWFRSWLECNLFEPASTWEELDWQVCWWLECLWEEGISKSYGNDTCSGLQHLLLTKRILPGALSLIGTWSKLEMPNRAAPMLPEFILALADYANMRGRPFVAATLLLAYHGFLRAGEIFRFG